MPLKTSALTATVPLMAALLFAGNVGAEPENNEEPVPAADSMAPPGDAVPPEDEALPPEEGGSPPEDAPPPEDAGPVFDEAAAPPEDAVPPPDEPAAPPFPDFASMWFAPAPEALPPGICDEHGMQVKTILVERNISEKFPEIHSMIGVRPDSQRWHPSGLAVDVMIPNPGSAEGIALGDAIVAYALRHSAEFDLQDAIWRGTYYTPAGPSGRGNGHYDHVHITTHGDGYPQGGEEYLREDD